jgi:hypothetical protein
MSSLKWVDSAWSLGLGRRKERRMAGEENRCAALEAGTLAGWVALGRFLTFYETVPYLSEMLISPACSSADEL